MSSIQRPYQPLLYNEIDPTPHFVKYGTLPTHPRHNWVFSVTLGAMRIQQCVSVTMGFQSNKNMPRQNALKALLTQYSYDHKFKKKNILLILLLKSNQQTLENVLQTKPFKVSGRTKVYFFKELLFVESSSANKKVKN